MRPKGRCKYCGIRDSEVVLQVSRRDISTRDKKPGLGRARTVSLCYDCGDNLFRSFERVVEKVRDGR